MGVEIKPKSENPFGNVNGSVDGIGELKPKSDKTKTSNKKPKESSKKKDE